MRRLVANRRHGDRAAPRDKRFADPEWKSNQFFDFVMRPICCRRSGARPRAQRRRVGPAHPQKAEFYVQQITNALAPSNFVLTNPKCCAKPWRPAATIWCAA